MIVKNESHIITDTLEKLIKKINIDYWVISDTGSTDTTKQLITDFFIKHDIKGELFDDEWQDFGHNRTVALEHAFGKCDYVFIFDADDEIVGDFELDTKSLSGDSYILKYGGGTSSHVSYDRTQIVNNHKKWKYTGVLHEYISALFPNPQPGTKLNGSPYYVLSGRTGSRSMDPDKYLKDAIVLEKAYYKAKESAAEQDHALYSRYAYYCANSYGEVGGGGGHVATAIEWYKKTLECHGWLEEKYNACFRIYELSDDKKSAMYYLVKSYEYNNRRVEGIYELIHHYCCIKQYKVAGAYYSLIKNYYENEYLTDDLSTRLFAKTDIYAFYLPYYMIIAASYNDDFETGLKMYDIIFKKKFVPTEWFLTHLNGNAKFYLEHCKNPVEFLSNLAIFSLHASMSSTTVK